MKLDRIPEDVRRQVLQSVCAEPSVFDTASSKAATVAAPVGGGATAPAEAAGLRVKLESVLQSLQEADRSFAADLGASTSGEATSPWAATANASWWSELQEKHPDLAHLVQTQRSELVRIVGSQGLTTPPMSPSREAPRGPHVVTYPAS